MTADTWDSLLLITLRDGRQWRVNLICWHVRVSCLCQQRCSTVAKCDDLRFKRHYWEEMKDWESSIFIEALSFSKDETTLGRSCRSWEGRRVQRTFLSKRKNREGGPCELCRISAEDWPALLTGTIGRVRQERQSSCSQQDAVGTSSQHLQVRLLSRTNLSCIAYGRAEPWLLHL